MSQQKTVRSIILVRWLKISKKKEREPFFHMILLFIPFEYCYYNDIHLNTPRTKRKKKHPKQQQHSSTNKKHQPNKLVKLNEIGWILNHIYNRCEPFYYFGNGIKQSKTKQNEIKMTTTLTNFSVWTQQLKRWKRKSIHYVDGNWRSVRRK